MVTIGIIGLLVVLAVLVGGIDATVRRRTAAAPGPTLSASLTRAHAARLGAWAGVTVPASVVVTAAILAVCGFGLGGMLSNGEMCVLGFLIGGALGACLGCAEGLAKASHHRLVADNAIRLLEMEERAENVGRPTDGGSHAEG